MIFEKAENLTTVIDIGLLERNPKYLFEHFMNYGDEVFYITEDGSLCGIVTPGDVIRSYQAKSIVPGINRDFSYVSDQEDYQGAERILETYPTIHEVAVVRDQVLLGVLRNGSRKSGGEWAGTRECLQAAADELEHDEWRKKQIQKVLERKTKIFVYRHLSVEDMGLTEDERKIYEGRNTLGHEHINALTEKEQMCFFGDHYNPSYALQWQQCIFFAHRIIYKNGIPELEDQSNGLCNVRNGHRVVPNAPERTAKKIFMFGPCTIFGAFVEDGQTVEAYLQKQLLEEGFEDYEVINSSAVFRDKDYEMARMLWEGIGDEDIIILMTDNFEQWNGFAGQGSGRLHCLESMSEIWKEIDRPVNHVFDHVMHCDAVVSEKIAEKMFRDIKGSLTKKKTDKSTIRRAQLQHYYISWDVVKACRKKLRNYAKLSGGGKLVLLWQPVIPLRRDIVI